MEICIAYYMYLFIFLILKNQKMAQFFLIFQKEFFFLSVKFFIFALINRKSSLPEIQNVYWALVYFIYPI